MTFKKGDEDIAIEEIKFRQLMNDAGVISYRNTKDDGHFMYKFRISDYHAAKILEYISQVPHESARIRSAPKPSNHNKGV